MGPIVLCMALAMGQLMVMGII
ncbi:hypothetical protein OIHEL45_06305 [Sulfitobacter indolifex HEL-45]|uniref:Uncharacterized protein n=1 Tax=Sulfitobacter indolifex HEL-45 TaxID=391624 RepID=A0ABP2DH10_9RHOB|nr:hypothetical protein OIHEL45_06305 [Sulfitobacter indolifex HEL-45]